MQGYPVTLNLEDKRCLVIGGGRIAERKVHELLSAHAKVTVISPHLTQGIQKLHTAGKIVYKQRRYKAGDTKNIFLVIAATNDRAVNKKIAAETTGLLNIVDMPDLCNVIMPFVINKGALSVAVSTSGISPSFAVTLGKEIETSIPADMPKYLEFVKKMRLKIQAEMPAGDKKQEANRMALLKELGSKKVLDMLRQKGFAAVKNQVDEVVKEKLC
jgi:precorrin-2 dehydrogenase/sirohydrochlorin ferrochelatase